MDSYFWDPKHTPHVIGYGSEPEFIVVIHWSKRSGLSCAAEHVKRGSRGPRRNRIKSVVGCMFTLENGGSGSHRSTRSNLDPQITHITPLGWNNHHDYLIIIYMLFKIYISGIKIFKKLYTMLRIYYIIILWFFLINY